MLRRGAERRGEASLRRSARLASQGFLTPFEMTGDLS